MSESGNGNGRLGTVEYADLVTRVQAAVAAHVPPGSTVLVVSKGDAALLEIPGVRAMHFPQDRSGAYAGHHPLDSASATAELEAQRRSGAGYLVIPATARWWLDFYAEFALHLATHGELVADDGACLIYGLGGNQAEVAGGPAITRPQASVEQIRDYLERLVAADRRLVVLEAVDGLAAGLAPLRAMPLRAGDTLDPDDGRVLAQLKSMARAGADYLVVPRSSDEWLDSASEFAAELESGCRKVAEQRHLCRVFDLEGIKEIA
jgi:hypothetical protein